MTADSRFDALTRQRYARACTHAREFYEKGWMPATSGNVSLRLPSSERGDFAVTATGMHKSELTVGAIGRQLSRRRSDGSEVDRREPAGSSDTAIHAALYRHIDAIGAVYHVHLVAATASLRRSGPFDASTPNASATLTLAWSDTIKAFGDWCDWSRGEPIDCTVAPNADAGDTATWIDTWLGSGDQTTPPGLNVADHGMYVWGRTPEETRRHVEAFGYLYSLRLMSR